MAHEDYPTYGSKGGRIGRPPSCECGECHKCLNRKASRERYRQMSTEQRAELIARRDKDRSLANDRARHWRHREERIARMNEYQRTSEGKAAKARGAQRHFTENPEAQSARHAVSNAVRDGRLTKGPCLHAMFGQCHGRIHGHHEDYDKPLDVVWLCAFHHRQLHEERRYQKEVA